jgi:tRNA(Ile)-lysidine synthase
VADLDELLTRCTFPPPSTAVEVGVSGGSDSTALLILAVAAGCDVTVVHIDHGLRAGSADEAAMVGATARRFRAGFTARRVEIAPGPNLEARARQARYEALGPDALVGHTLDDRAETILLHLLRGAGADGLTALRPPDPRRPLLGLRRSETVAVCAELGVATLDDPSNQDLTFRRNRVRHQLLPLLDEIAERDVAPLLVRTGDLVAQDEQVLAALADRVDPTDARALADAPRSIAARSLRRWLAASHDGYAPGSAEVERVLAVARGEAVATQLAGGERVARTGQRLRIEPADG